MLGVLLIGLPRRIVLYKSRLFTGLRRFPCIRNRFLTVFFLLFLNLLIVRDVPWICHGCYLL